MQCQMVLLEHLKVYFFHTEQSRLQILQIQSIFQIAWDMVLVGTWYVGKNGN